MFYLGLVLAKDYLDSLVHLEDDSSLIMNLLSNIWICFGPMKIQNILLDCRQVVIQNPQLSISYIFLEIRTKQPMLWTLSHLGNIYTSLKWNCTPFPHRMFSILVMGIYNHEEFLIE